MKIDDAVALVTGANRGIGRILVLALRDAGAKRVHAAARRPEQVDAAGGAVVPLALDVTAPGSIARIAEEVQDVTLLIGELHRIPASSGGHQPGEET
jgi:NAD(P)-dependent dehydrogenase (short-subunit alcohol dehydrogenase family)